MLQKRPSSARMTASGRAGAMALERHVAALDPLAGHPAPDHQGGDRRDDPIERRDQVGQQQDDMTAAARTRAKPGSVPVRAESFRSSPMRSAARSAQGPVAGESRSASRANMACSIHHVEGKHHAGDRACRLLLIALRQWRRRREWRPWPGRPTAPRSSHLEASLGRQRGPADQDRTRSTASIPRVLPDRHARGRWLALVTAEGRTVPQTDEDHAKPQDHDFLFGPLSVGGRQGRHQVEVAWNESGSAASRCRLIRFEGDDLLHIESPADAHPNIAVGWCAWIVTWQRDRS